jgi:DNA-binding XRE family transcriptional regulator
MKTTSQERLRIWRRRQKWKQMRAAKHFQVSPQQYFRWESGQDLSLPGIKLGRLEPFEVCFLLRRRSGLRQEDLAKDLNVCRWWLNQMERGLVDYKPLLSYWNGNARQR